jgi:alanine dehydrogenase
VIPVISGEAVLSAVTPAQAIERTREAFVRHARGEWVMPAKVYLDSPPGDFRAMPARGSGVALLKWVTSYPQNPERGLPVVTGVIVLSDADTGAELAILDARSVTWLRTGAAAAVSAQVLAPTNAITVGVIGCGVNGAWAARCLAAVGYGPGVCHDRDVARAEQLASERAWRTGTREEAVTADIVVTCTPGDEPVIEASDVRESQHIVALGADAHGKAELQRDALRRCHLFCDEWEQASGGGELSGAVAAGEVSRGQVTQLGEVLAGAAKGRSSEEETTMFDSTGLAIQDLGIALGVFRAWEAGRIAAQSIEL